MCFEIEIINDNTFEGVTPETFEVEITILAGQIGDLQGVVADPPVTLVSIIDDDQVLVVGFEQDLFQANESAGVVEVCAGFLDLSPDEVIEVEFGVQVLLNDTETTAGKCNSMHYMYTSSIGSSIGSLVLH